jgi:aspartyl-tRNA(Asn)/glutamyl-tRNA(Gln) amidotransferase subunit C
MAITRDDVLHVAGLARLEIPEDQVDTVRDQLGAILEAVGKVSELDLADVEPMTHPLDLVNEWAEDEPRPSLTQEEALANAPDPAEGSFRVPAVGG